VVVALFGSDCSHGGSDIAWKFHVLGGDRPVVEVWLGNGRCQLFTQEVVIP
jgi:hypothetical protein